MKHPHALLPLLVAGALFACRSGDPAPAAENTAPAAENTAPAAENTAPAEAEPAHAAADALPEVRYYLIADT